MSEITYTVVKITEKKADSPNRRVIAVIDKTMRLNSFSSPMTETFSVVYPVWDNEHRTNLVESIPPHRKIDNLTRINIAKKLKELKF